MFGPTGEVLQPAEVVPVASKFRIVISINSTTSWRNSMPEKFNHVDLDAFNG